MRIHRIFDLREFSPGERNESCGTDVVSTGWPPAKEAKRIGSRLMMLICCVEGDDNPEETLTSASTEDGDHEPPSEEKDILDNLRPVSPKPGHIERVKAPMSPQSKRHDPREARFLKINVRHITDGQVCNRRN